MDCCLTNSDAHVVGGSEDGRLFFWDLVDASVVSSFRAHSSVVINTFSFLFSLFSFLSKIIMYIIVIMRQEICNQCK